MWALKPQKILVRDSDGGVLRRCTGLDLDSSPTVPKTHFKKVVVSGHCLICEMSRLTIKLMALVAAIFNARVILVVAM